MGYVKRQSIKESIVLIASLLIGVVTTLFVYPNYLTTEQYGLLKFLLDTSSFASPFILLGTHNLAIRFFPDFKNKDSGHTGFLSLLLLLTLGGILVFLILVFFFQDSYFSLFQNKDDLVLANSKHLILLSVLFSLLYLLSNYCINFHRTVVPSLINNLFIKAGVAVFVVLYAYFEFTGFNIGYALITLNLLGLIMIVSYMYKQSFLHLNYAFLSIKIAKLKEMAVYAFYGIIGGLGEVIAHRIDTFMVAALINLSNLGIFGIAQYISNVIAIPQKTITKILLASIAQAFKDNDMQSIEQLYKRTSIINFTIGSFLFLGIWVSIDDLFSLMPKGEIYSQGRNVLLILSVAKLVDLVTGINNQIISYSKFFRFNFYATLFLASLNIINNLLLIPKFQIEGAALASLLSILIFNLAKYLFVWKKFNIQPFTWNTLKVIGIAILTYLLHLLIPTSSFLFVDIIIRSVFITLIFGSASLYLKVSEDINDLFFNWISSFSKK